MRGSVDAPGAGPRVATPPALSGFRSDAAFLPDEPHLGFVEIPGGDFIMGSDPGRDFFWVVGIAKASRAPAASSRSRACPRSSPARWSTLVSSTITRSRSIVALREAV